MKIFGIGLNKTGTTSLHGALQALGFQSLHWGGPEIKKLVEDAHEQSRPLVADLPEYDAFSDIWALSRRFDVLDHQYPGSRFILTTRSLESWIDSRTRHVHRNQIARAEGRYFGGFLRVEPDLWRQQFVDHHAAVYNYFSGRADLLVMRITEGDGYDALCPFLGTVTPAAPFPALNRK